MNNTPVPIQWANRATISSFLFSVVVLFATVTLPEAMEKIGTWRYVIGGIAVVGVFYAVYRFGFWRGAQSVGRVEVVRTVEVPAPAPVEAEGKNRAVSDLRYSVEEVTELLSEKGGLNDRRIGMLMQRIEREHVAWNVPYIRPARSQFRTVVTNALHERTAPVRATDGHEGPLDLTNDTKVRLRRTSQHFVTQLRLYEAQGLTSAAASSAPGAIESGTQGYI